MTPFGPQLLESDTRYWHPILQVLGWLRQQYRPDFRILEIGPGTVPFPDATHYVDMVSLNTVPREKLTVCDITKERLPFPDKHFDFVFCRHTVEDMLDPFRACEEMSRVGKSGYIETPSPLVELCRGADGDAPPYRGYHHHRFVVWAYEGVLNFVTKYPVVEYLKIDDAVLVSTLRSGPRYWNTYFPWVDRIPVKHWQSPLDFDIPSEYPRILREAVAQSVIATNVFCEMIQRSEDKAA